MLLKGLLVPLLPVVALLLLIRLLAVPQESSLCPDLKNVTMLRYEVDRAPRPITRPGVSLSRSLTLALNVITHVRLHFSI